MTYKNLEIWKMARDLSIDIHKMTLALPKFEQFEEASQIRKSSKNVRSTIVEGYGRRYYKADYIKHIIYALASMMKQSIILKCFTKQNRLPIKLPLMIYTKDWAYSDVKSTTSFKAFKRLTRNLVR